jgi:hypothetical protein
VTTALSFRRTVLLCALGLAGLASIPAQAASASETQVDAKRRIWRVREFTTIQIVPREAQATAPNQHPVATIQPESLQKQLMLIQKVDPSGNQSLFDKDEAETIALPLAQALANAGPEDDVQLLSSARRAFMGPPQALTARVFAQDDALNIIVHETSLDFVVAYRTTNILPKFQYGSRTRASKAKLQSAAATSKRADWVALPLAPLMAAPAPSATAAPAAAPARVAPPVAPPAPVVAAPAPAAPPAPAVAVKPGEIEERLATLKRLFDRGLINNEEYQQKRKELLQAL